MNKPMQSALIKMACCFVFTAQAFSERLNLGEGLAIEQPTVAEISYQVIPSYNASKKMLQRRSEDKLQYFINVDRLPRSANDADRYFERLLRDISDTSTPDSLQIIDQGKYWTENNVQGTYIEYQFTLIGTTQAQHHIAHFLTNTYRTFIATAVLLNTESQQKMHDESIALFSSASISMTNMPMPKIENATK